MGLKYLLGVHDLIVLADVHPLAAICLRLWSGEEWVELGGEGAENTGRSRSPTFLH